MRNLLAAVLVLFAACSAHAQLSIEITGAGAQRIPIAIAPLAGEGALLDASGDAIGAIVRADLASSTFGQSNLARSMRVRTSKRCIAGEREPLRRSRWMMCSRQVEASVYDFEHAVTR
jgi:Tol biopolymer transport system component